MLCTGRLCSLIKGEEAERGMQVRFNPRWALGRQACLRWAREPRASSLLASALGQQDSCRHAPTRKPLAFHPRLWGTSWFPLYAPPHPPAHPPVAGDPVLGVVHAPALHHAAQCERHSEQGGRWRQRRGSNTQ